MPAENAVTLRPAEAGDAAAVARIWYLGWQDGHLGNVPDELLAIRTEDSFTARAAQRIEDTTDTTVATVDGSVVGFVMVVEDEVEQVYVAREHRGSGVAALLLADAERLVAEAGYEQAWLAVVGGNARARRFYERGGWRDEGRFDYAAASEDGPIPVPSHRYVKDVTPPARSTPPAP
ncbi:GNAT family N-acetyltransferase [Prauserella flavalba]|uniref:GCN5 family acetyltransferase n=1 Tax=Prauserella flavalba TaxID=1477506 RepID=A0A318LMY4_9PSEU|nr:GNAT family N-acetyltransferase [Prauserella flavalba]PXY35833.1 GCN5 family acetyltransferase [Prauserella flavalba]